MVVTRNRNQKRNFGLSDALDAMEVDDVIWVEGVGHAAAHSALAQRQKQGEWKGRAFSQEAFKAVKSDWSDIADIFRITRLK